MVRIFTYLYKKSITALQILQILYKRKFINIALMAKLQHAVVQRGYFNHTYCTYAILTQAYGSKLLLSCYVLVKLWGLFIIICLCIVLQQ